MNQVSLWQKYLYFLQAYKSQNRQYFIQSILQFTEGISENERTMRKTEVFSLKMLKHWPEINLETSTMEVPHMKFEWYNGFFVLYIENHLS
jgi:hypothetical protein